MGAYYKDLEIYVVNLPVGCHDLGFQVEGATTGTTPLVITSVAKDSPLQGRLFVGHYIHGLLMPDIEIVNLSIATHLMEMLHLNVANQRQLLISSTPYYVDPSTGTRTLGAMYKHKLPSSSSSMKNGDLGFAMRGFPPVISTVQPTSIMTGRLHPGQTVEALLIPGQPVMNLAAGAFTSSKVQERLLRTAHITGRQLVVKDGAPPQREKGSNAAFDDCVIM